MARYVLVEFDDNDGADNFVKLIQQGEGVMDGEQKTSGIRIRGVFFKPTQFCSCSSPGDTSVLGAKYGLRIHKECGKPKPGICQHPRNLLDPKEMPVKFRMEYLGIWEPSERGGIAWERGDSRPKYKEKWK